MCYNNNYNYELISISVLLIIYYCCDVTEWLELVIFYRLYYTNYIIEQLSKTI